MVEKEEDEEEDKAGEVVIPEVAEQVPGGPYECRHCHHVAFTRKGQLHRHLCDTRHWGPTLKVHLPEASRVTPYPYLSYGRRFRDICSSNPKYTIIFSCQTKTKSFMAQTGEKKDTETGTQSWKRTTKWQTLSASLLSSAF